MPETPAKTAEPAAPDAEPGGWGAMDTAGLIAGVILIFIVADILTDGRVISRRLRGQPKPAEPEVPVE